MTQQTRSAIRLLEALTERAKELSCLYAIEEALKDPDAHLDQVCGAIIAAIPPGWQYPEICRAKIVLEGREHVTPGFEETPWKLSANIVQQDGVAGAFSVYYTQEMPAADFGPFLKEEKKLVETIANRLGHFLTYKKTTRLLAEWQAEGRGASESRRGDWEGVLDIIRQTDKALFLRLANKMLNHLCWSGIEEAEGLRRALSNQGLGAAGPHDDDTIPPRAGRLLEFSTEFTEKIFRVAADCLSREEILSRIQMWIQEDRLGALLLAVHRHLPLSEVSSALRRYVFTTHEEPDDRYPMVRGLKVLLIGRILSDRLQYINVAKNYVDVADLQALLQKMIFSAESHGKVGGKGAGLFLACQILRKTKDVRASRSSFRIPKTWWVPSDMMLHFVRHNNMDEIIGQKYKEIERIRFEFPRVVDMLKRSPLPPEMVNGLSAALEDFGDRPLVVRSSSLLEDVTGCAFEGKYGSVFLSNRGTKEERLNDLTRAVAEVYASNFGPDPIEYRARRGLLEFSEQLGIMIQEVVGIRLGPYFLPVYSGVARSRNDFRGSSEIKAEDGVVRVLPGLGTRARDRTGNERPVVLVPGRPSFRTDRYAEECVRHAPETIEAINLETGAVQRLELNRLLREFGDAFPGVEQLVSVYENGQLRPPDKDKLSFEEDRLVVTFDGLATRSPFASQIRDLLHTLEGNLGVPVEIEFASDGEHFYLLQCRPQTIARSSRPAAIPTDLARDDIVFSANRHVSNGSVRGITHVVYVDPEAYEAIEEPSRYDAIERAVGRLNAILPKRQFVLMLPGGRPAGRDVRNGAGFAYGDVDNAAVVVELLGPELKDAKDLSFGARFLPALLESDVRYLPLFPADEQIHFNRRFLLQSSNILLDLLPDRESLVGVLRVIDVSKTSNGKVMQLLMNADLGKAVAFLTEPDDQPGQPAEGEPFEEAHPESYWRWRRRMAEELASRLDPARFGVAGLYVFGSTKNGTAGPASDIDLLVHFRGTDAQRQALRIWLEGWSLCLDDVNYLQTGYRSGGLLDVHFVTDEDIATRTSYAVRINAVTDAAQPLKMADRVAEDGGKQEPTSTAIGREPTHVHLRSEADGRG